MPIYEYECKQCRKSFEKLVKRMEDNDVKVPCPECGSRQTGRKLSAFAAVSSGGGGKSESLPTGCGRCGGPGPCGMN